MRSLTMEDLVEKGRRLGAIMQERGLMLCAAESCTGGLLAHVITEAAGSSGYFVGSAVTYSNEAKQGVLGVRPEVLKEAGAVSAQCAQEMAQGALRLFGADVALAITGIAGPGGGTPQKPVGTVYLHLSTRAGEEIAQLRVWDADRSANKRLSVDFALTMLSDILT